MLQFTVLLIYLDSVSVGWWERSCLGGIPNNAPPPPSLQSCFFVSWTGTRIMSHAEHAMTVGHCAIHLGGWGATSPPPPPLPQQLVEGRFKESASHGT